MTIIGLIFAAIGKVISDVLLDILKSPGVETSVENVEGPLDSPTASTDDLLDQFKWMHDRG